MAANPITFPIGHNSKPPRPKRRGAQEEPAPTWDDYPRIDPGSYRGYCRLAKWYFAPQFKRWVCFICFDIFSASNLETPIAAVPLFLNGGRKREAHAGRGSRYFELWIQANGDVPKRKERLTPRVFTGRWARVEVGDTKGRAPYSVVKTIHEWETGWTSFR